MRQIEEIILHCSANGPNSTIGAKEIREYHIKGRGWKDIGYHYVIKRDGTLEKGRDLAQPGAHCTNHNQRSIGICLVGGVARDGKTPEDNFTPRQFDTLAQLLRSLRRDYPMASIHGHNEFANKACPVFNVDKFLQGTGIAKRPWNTKRWPHFQPKELGEGWGGGAMPQLWEDTLDGLESLRSLYGHPIVIARGHVTSELSGVEDQHNFLACDIKVPEQLQEWFCSLAKKAGFTTIVPMPHEGQVHVSMYEAE